MEIPFKRVVWNEHEATLLVDVYERVRSGVVSRDQAIANLSERLRNRMVLDGVEINDKYRNTAGVDLQLLSIERSIDGNGEIVECPQMSKVFRVIYALSKYNRSAYDILLKDAIILYPEINKQTASTSGNNVSYDIATDGAALVASESDSPNYNTTSEFDWNKYEAALLVEGFYQIEKGLIVKDEILTLLKKRFENCSPVVGRTSEPNEQDIEQAMFDLSLLSSNRLHAINEMLQTAFDNYYEHTNAFHENLDSAKKLYPIEKNSFFTFSNKSNRNAAPSPVSSNKVALGDKQNKIKRESTPDEPVKESNAAVLKVVSRSVISYQARSNEKFLEYAKSKGINRSSISIYTFFGIGGLAYHVAPADNFRQTENNSYKQIHNEFGVPFVVWPVLCNTAAVPSEELIALLSETLLYKTLGKVVKQAPKELSKEQVVVKKSVVKKYNVPNQRLFKPLALKVLELRVRHNSETVRAMYDYSMDTRKQRSLLFGIEDYACHVVPCDTFVGTGDVKHCRYVANSYGVKFVAWFVDVTNKLTDEEALELVNESIVFRTLKTGSQTEIVDLPSEQKTDNNKNVVTSPTVGNATKEKVNISKSEAMPKRKQPDTKVLAILVGKFAKGYRLGSAISRKRFAQFYTNQYNVETPYNDEQLERVVSECGIIYEGMLYVPSIMISMDTRKALFDDIEKQFSDGIQCIYYNVLFKAFNQEFLGQNMVSGEMLRLYLEFYNEDGIYHFEKQYFSKGGRANVDINTEVLDYVKAQGGSVTEDEVVDALSHFPRAKVVEAFSTNRQTLVLSGMRTRFHIDNFQFEREDHNAIASYLTREIADMQYVTFSELYNKMQSIAPRVIDNNIQFNQVGIRTALASLLADEFCFIGGFISDHDNPLSIQDAFIGMGRGRDSFAIEEVEKMAEDFNNAPINFEALAVRNVRVSEELYVSKDIIHFDIDAVDDAIERFSHADIISISEVNTFTVFPECGYRWTPFLLESFLYSYSKRFKLEHKSFNKNSVTGAIVRRTARFNDYKDIMAAVLAKASIKLEPQSCIVYLAEHGFIERRRLQAIDEVIKRAELLNFN